MDYQQLAEQLRALNEINQSELSPQLLQAQDFSPQCQPLVQEINRALQISQEKVRQVQRNLDVINGIIHSGMWSMEFDPSGQMTKVTWSQAFRIMVGFQNVEEFPNTLDTWSDRLHPQDRESTLTAFWDAVAGRGEYNVEYRLMTHSGQYKWFRATGRVLRREDGSPSLFLGIFVDISQQKQAQRLEQEKLAAERQAAGFQAELENQNDILTALCSDYLAVYRVNLSTEAYEIYRLSQRLRPDVIRLVRRQAGYAATMAGYCSTFVSPEDQSAFLAATHPQAVLERLSREQTFFLRYHVKENSQHMEHFEVHFARAGKWPEEQVAVVGFRNVDADIRREEAYKLETRHDIEETLEGSRTGLWTMEMEEGRPSRMYADRTMCMLLGTDQSVSPEECYHIWFSRIDPEYVEMVQEGVQAIANSGRAEVIYPWNHPTLGQIYIRCGGVPDHKYTGPGLRLKGYHQDITETMVTRKQQEKALLEALVEAKQANRAKTEFLSHMSHDIRTPINGILGMLAISEKNPLDLERQADCRNKIQAAAQHLLSLINDVLDISKLESGSTTLARESFSLPDVLENCLTILRPQAEEEQLSLTETRIDLAYPRLLGSPLHLRQILINIIGNAVKYNRPGGSISVETRQLPLDGDTVRCRFTISDTGLGMSEEFQTRLFEPFTQEHSSARTHYAGTGLGMAITKRLVEAMGGEITARSVLGEGSTFTVEIPFPVDCNYTPVQEPAPETVDVAGLHVMLVEDNELNREIAQYMLEDAGVTVVIAENGQQALDLFAASPAGTFDGILMDVMMPVMDGLEATAAIRALDRPDAKTVPIIAMTANAFAEDVEKSKAAGMNAHLAKPVDLQKLLQVLTAYCRPASKS